MMAAHPVHGDARPIDPRADVVLVTGPAGAGRSTAIRALEDLGFEAIDNLPLAFLPRLVTADTLDRPLAIGVDARTRGFSAESVAAARAAISAAPGRHVTLLYLDARPEALLRRFSETRRRHPLAQGEGPEAGLLREAALLAPLRPLADVVIDTSDLTPHELKAEIGRHFAPGGGPGLGVLLESFSFKRGTPRALDLQFDLRFLRNPHWVDDLRGRDGRDPLVAAHVEADPRFTPFFGRLVDLILHLLPAYKAEGKAYLCIGLGCTGGKHRSVVVAEATAKRLVQEGWPVSIRHRELERQGV